MAGQQGQPKYGFGWPDCRLGGLGPAGSTTPDQSFSRATTPEGSLNKSRANSVVCISVGNC